MTETMTVITVPLRETYVENQYVEVPVGSTLVGMREVMQGRYEVVVFAPVRVGVGLERRWVRLICNGYAVPGFHEPRFVGTTGVVHLLELTEPF